MNRSLVLLLSIVFSTLCSAQYPERPPKLMVPFPPGGAADTFARLAGQKLTDAWGKAVVVENKPGAGGIIATDATAKAPADGYNFLIVTVGHAVNPSLYPKLPFDTLNDLAPVAMVANVPNVLVVHPSVPANSVAELIKLAKSKPGGLKYASSGNATTSHMAAALLSSLAGIEMLHVPYKGAAPAVQDLVAGRTDLMLDPTVSSGAFVKQGRLRALAVTTAKRTPLLPELPTLAEAGVPGYEFNAWFLLLAPAKTPADAISKVNAELAKAGGDAAYKERLANLGAEPAPAMSPAQVGSFIASEVKRWAKVVKDANIKVE
jgi:tripartite-type tricarboxylate transporter receptor subunit TctC